ncbi:MAG: hypothetical protein CYPHOPRED_004139 [Cyphobasidiales sp. Tagirdzhanova-0007]|nr:MAG: hypothetical protein CYPHOPRED_004139 [Cyphobasidiales sp. Tagirdzhanova-0007]
MRLINVSAALATAFALLAAMPIASVASIHRRLVDIASVDDAAFAEIAYSGNWTHLSNQGAIDYLGTESYSHDANASYTFGRVEKGGIITIYAGKKDDRGQFDVFQGDVFLGRGDAHNASCSANCSSAQVFTYDNLPTSDNITVRNHTPKTYNDTTPFLDVDWIKIQLTTDCLANGICPL